MKIKLKPVITPRLIVRPFKISDFKAWEAVAKNTKPAQNSWDHGRRRSQERSLKIFKKMLKRYAGWRKLDRIYKFGAFEKKSGLPIGTTDIMIIARGPIEWANLGYAVNNRFWKQGFGKEMSLATLKIAFEQLGLQRVEASMDVKNRASQKLARSLGMKKECRRKKFIRGEKVKGKQLWKDAYVYTILSDELPR